MNQVCYPLLPQKQMMVLEADLESDILPLPLDLQSTLERTILDPLHRRVRASELVEWGYCDLTIEVERLVFER